MQFPTQIVPKKRGASTFDDSPPSRENFQITTLEEPASVNKLTGVDIDIAQQGLPIEMGVCVRHILSQIENPDLLCEKLTSRRPIKDTTVFVIDALAKPPLYVQSCVSRTLEHLFGTGERWMDVDEQRVGNGKLEVRAGVWMLVAEPSGLTEGLARGMSTLEVARKRESEWLAHPDVTEIEKDVVKSFAMWLHRWGWEVAERMGQVDKQ